MAKEILETVALSLIPGLGTTRLQQLLRSYGSARKLLAAGRPLWCELGLEREVVDWVVSGGAVREAEAVVERCRSLGVEIVWWGEARYPHLLSQIFDPPVVLYCWGDVSHLLRPAVALVGSRRCSPYGREVTRLLARQLAGYGLTVVSGMARGIDSWAHAGALEAGGSTVAVLGCGVDVVYPRENRRLYERIRDQGCLVSEFPLGCHPAPENFPVRNRIISGLCYGTIISEAAEFSGSLITARLTLEQDRELWAVPGNITNSGSYGPNYLIKQGAHPVITAQDVLDELPVYVLDRLLHREEADFETDHKTPPLNEEERAVLELISCDQPRHFDALLSQCRLEISALNQALFQLESKGLIYQLPGRRFCRRLRERGEIG